jgi:hypothetical protein
VNVSAEDSGDVDEGVGCAGGGDGAEEGKSGGKRARGNVPRNWTLVKRIKEDHGQVLFGLSVNNYDERWKNLFATTGANRCTVYELLPEGNLDVRQVWGRHDACWRMLTYADV